MLLRVRAAVLMRYRRHRMDALVSTFLPCDPQHPLLAVSWKIKWDETEQVVAVLPDAGPLELMDKETLKRSSRKMHVITTGVWVFVFRCGQIALVGRAAPTAPAHHSGVPLGRAESSDSTRKGV